MSNRPILAFALLALCSCRAENRLDRGPLGGYSIVLSNGVLPICGVYLWGKGAFPLTKAFPLTNWLSVTSDSSPKVITSILKSQRTSVAAPGQRWVSASASYINTPEVHEHIGETNGIWSFETYKTTNDWPQIANSVALIYVSWIEKADGGRVKGLDYYAHCRVRLWNHTMVESDAILLLSSLTNDCTLLPNTPP